MTDGALYMVKRRLLKRPRLVDDVGFENSGRVHDCKTSDVRT